jgi:ureidoglycolate hydrolase
MTEVSEVWVQAKPLTHEAFEPYGQLISAGAVATATRGEEELTLDVIHYERRPFRIDHLNRHHHATQSLLPMAGRACCIVVGRPELTFADVAELEQLEAFLLDGRTGINLAIGTWHEGPWPVMESVDLLNLQGRHVVARDNEVARLPAVVRVAL